MLWNRIGCPLCWIIAQHMLYRDATRKLNGSKLFIVLLLYLFFLVKEFFTQNTINNTNQLTTNMQIYMHGPNCCLSFSTFLCRQNKRKGLEDKVPNSSLPSIKEREFNTFKGGGHRSKSLWSWHEWSLKGRKSTKLNICLVWNSFKT
jgi:hypothetical protein